MWPGVGAADPAGRLTFRELSQDLLLLVVAILGEVWIAGFVGAVAWYNRRDLKYGIALGRRAERKI